MSSIYLCKRTCLPGISTKHVMPSSNTIRHKPLYQSRTKKPSRSKALQCCPVYVILSSNEQVLLLPGHQRSTPSLSWSSLLCCPHVVQHPLSQVQQLVSSRDSSPVLHSYNLRTNSSICPRKQTGGWHPPPHTTIEQMRSKAVSFMLM